MAMIYTLLICDNNDDDKLKTMKIQTRHFCCCCYCYYYYLHVHLRQYHCARPCKKQKI